MWTSGISGVVLGGYNLQWFIIRSAEDIDPSLWPGVRSCYTRGNYHFVYETLESILYSFIIMFLTNFAITLKLMTAKCQGNQSSSTASTNQVLAKAAIRGAAMVVAVSVTILILTAPEALDKAMYSFISLRDLSFYRTFMNLTQYLNHSINGILYCIVGTRFGMELGSLFKRNRPI